MNNIIKSLYFLFILLFISSCGDDVSGLTVDEYIEQNNLDTKELDEGVHIVIYDEGNSIKPNINSIINIAYEGRLTDGTIFDSNDDFTSPLSGLIQGWRIGMKEIGEGGSCTLIIPSEAGYGRQQAGSIPPNSTLVFDIDLIDVQ